MLATSWLSGAGCRRRELHARSGPGSRMASSVPPFKEAHSSPYWGLEGQRVRP